MIHYINTLRVIIQLWNLFLSFHQINSIPNHLTFIKSITYASFRFLNNIDCLIFLDWVLVWVLGWVSCIQEIDFFTVLGLFFVDIYLKSLDY